MHGEERMDEKEMEKNRKYKHYQITFWFIPEIDEILDDLSHHYIREYLKELLNNNIDVKSFLSIPRSEANNFFANDYIPKRIYVNKELHEKWKALPRGIKKRIYYLVNKKLMEVLKDELQTTHHPS
jgi:hypothetical protein